MSVRKYRKKIKIDSKKKIISKIQAHKKIKEYL